MGKANRWPKGHQARAKDWNGGTAKPPLADHSVTAGRRSPEQTVQRHGVQIHEEPGGAAETGRRGSGPCSSVSS